MEISMDPERLCLQEYLESPCRSTNAHELSFSLVEMNHIENRGELLIEPDVPTKDSGATEKIQRSSLIDDHS